MGSGWHYRTLNVARKATHRLLAPARGWSGGRPSRRRC